MPFVKQPLDVLSFTIQTLQREWTAEEIPVLQAVISIPQTSSDHPGPAERRLNRYYRQCANAFLRYCQRFLYPQALADFTAARQTGAPLPCAHASVECTATCNQSGVFSSYMDCTEWKHTSHALTLRRADTWDLHTGYPIGARDCFAKGAPVRRLCLQAARTQCAQKSRAGLAHYADHLPHRLRRHLNLRNFYLTAEGFYFFYQPYTIAAGAEGIPTFTILFSEEKCGPIWPISPV